MACLSTARLDRHYAIKERDDFELMMRAMETRLDAQADDLSTARLERHYAIKARNDFELKLRAVEKDNREADHWMQRAFSQRKQMQLMQKDHDAKWKWVAESIFLHMKIELGL